MGAVIPWANLITHNRYDFSWALNSLLCQRVPRSTPYWRKTVFSTWAPARSGLEFNWKISNSLLLFVHGSVDLCPIPEFSFFFQRQPVNAAAFVWKSLHVFNCAVVSLSGFLFITIPSAFWVAKCLMVLRVWENHEFILCHNDLFSFPFLS